MVDLGMEFADVNASSCQFFSLTQALQKGSHVTSEEKALKIKKNRLNCFDEIMVNSSIALAL